MMKLFHFRSLLIIGLLAVLVGVFGGTGYIHAEEKPGNAMELTVYNENLALVKDRRNLEISAGIAELRFMDVAALIDPTSVKFRSLSVPGVRVLEQNYEYDVINDAKMLQKYLGQKIRLLTVKGESYEGYLLSAQGNIILSSQPGGGEVRILKADQIQMMSFPELPGGLVIKPTLVWLLANPGHAGNHQTELTYLTGGLSWKANYVATINATDDKIDLIGWVTLNNTSGTDYRDARLKLVAGDVHRAPAEGQRQQVIAMLYKSEQAPQNGFQEESFFEYHLYTLGRPATVKNNQMKQIELLTTSSVPAKKLYIYEGAAEPKKVKVMMELKNSKENNLGMPLPKGVIRVNKADGEGSLQFIGEDRIDHTPKDEKVRIYLGNAFDVVGERVRMNVKEISSTVREETYQIKLRNHKNEAITVTAVEPMSQWHEWQITNSSHKYTKTEAGKVEFEVNVPANGEVVVTYTVRYKW